MSETTKTILKTYFETGDIPTQDNFEDLIDSLQAITPSTDQSVAIGKDAVVSGKQSLQIGDGTNTHDNSLKVGGNGTGTGLIILGSEPVDKNLAPNGSMWVDSFGYITFKSNNKIIKIK